MAVDCFHTLAVHEVVGLELQKAKTWQKQMEMMTIGEREFRICRYCSYEEVERIQSGRPIWIPRMIVRAELDEECR